MRSLTSTLLATQKETSRTPFVKVEAKDKIAGVVRLDWTRLYTGSEADYFHTLTIPDDGSLIRVRITPPSDASYIVRGWLTLAQTLISASGYTVASIMSLLSLAVP